MNSLHFLNFGDRLQAQGGETGGPLQAHPWREGIPPGSPELSTAAAANCTSPERRAPVNKLESESMTNERENPGLGSASCQAQQPCSAPCQAQGAPRTRRQAMPALSSLITSHIITQPFPPNRPGAEGLTTATASVPGIWCCWYNPSCVVLLCSSPDATSETSVQRKPSQGQHGLLWPPAFGPTIPIQDSERDREFVLATILAHPYPSAALVTTTLAHFAIRLLAAEPQVYILNYGVIIADPRLQTNINPDSEVGSSNKRRCVDDARGYVSLSSDSIKQGDDDEHNLDTLLDDDNSQQSTVSGPDEEAEVYRQTRMLEDPKRRLIYIGDSATLSFLQLIRMWVDNIAGDSSFTTDPSRHRIMEATITIPYSSQPPQLLPNKQTADVLVQSYFTNTHGLVDIFDRKSFRRKLESCYMDPLEMKPSDLCMIYLVLAIGLVMATPGQNSPEHVLIARLRSQPVDRAEVLFRSAKCLGDPLSGFEDGDLWSVQALSLMSVYMLAVTKRSAAYAYCGMAVRSAYALGLHRIGDMAMKVENTKVTLFTNEQVAERRNIWRSLFVLDRFLAVSLGRPTAISGEDCAEDSLEAPLRSLDDEELADEQLVTEGGLDAAVGVCRVIGKTLKKVYSQRKTSINLAQEIAEDYRDWKRNIHPTLRSKKLFNGNIMPAQGMAILHTQLFGYHSMLLLTRPFFSYLFVNILTAINEKKKTPHRPSSRMKKFSEACLSASTRTVALVQAAFESNYLPKRNPFVLYFLFSATLIILSNEFASLHDNPQYDTSIFNAINIMTYCATSDVQANRLVFILTAFRDVAQAHIQSPSSSQSPQSTYRTHLSTTAVKEERLDALPSPCHSFGEDQYNTPTPPRLGHTGSSTAISHVSQAPMNLRTRAPTVMIGPSDPMATTSAVSPAIRYTPASQAMAERSGRHGNYSEGYGPRGAEEMIHFDNFQNVPDTDRLGQTLGLTPISPIHQPPARSSTGYGSFPEYGMLPSGQLHIPNVVIDPRIPFYQPEYYSIERNQAEDYGSDESTGLNYNRDNSGKTLGSTDRDVL
ncbi:Fc.00g110300.m01.CDS01 [Cosmosporella sp. VM-42]